MAAAIDGWPRDPWVTGTVAASACARGPWTTGGGAIPKGNCASTTLSMKIDFLSSCENGGVDDVVGIGGVFGRAGGAALGCTSDGGSARGPWVTGWPPPPRSAARSS